MMCEHDFRLNADGEVACIKCFARDDEMELPVGEHSLRMPEVKAPEFWASQVTFEE